MNQTSYSLTIRFPSGTEFWMSEALPSLGAAISHGGREYLITQCEQTSRCEFVFAVAEKPTGEKGSSPLATVAHGATGAGRG